MEFFPNLEWGWLNGWLLLGLLCLTEGVCFLLFPKAVAKRLFDRSGWSEKQVVFTVIGKLVALVCLTLLIFTPLKLGAPVFFIGAGVTVLGLSSLLAALLNFKDTPLDQPVSRGMYVSHFAPSPNRDVFCGPVRDVHRHWLLGGAPCPGHCQIL